MPKVDPTVCPNCKGPVERQGRDYYCENCNLVFRPEKAKVSTQELLEEPLAQIRALKRRLRVLGALMALYGIGLMLLAVSGSSYVFGSALATLFFVGGLLFLAIGIYLIL
jgi:hypothetical protein